MGRHDIEATLQRLTELATTGHISRRDLLRRATALGLSASTVALLLAACGEDDEAAVTTAPTAAALARATTSTSQTALTATPAVPATQAATPAVVKSGGALTVAFAVDPVSLDPAGPIEYQTRMLRGCIHEALIDTDPQGKPIPWLAESFERTDPTTYVFHLRKGVKFHDGTPFDAEAVKFNIERMLNPETKNAAAGELANVDKVEVVDASTVRISAKGPSAAFVFPFFDVNGMQISPTAAQKWGPDYGVHPVGTGPFKFVEYQKDVHTVVERNPDYWNKGKPYLDRITFRPITEGSTRLTELRTGSVHIAEKLPVQNLDQVRGIEGLVVSEKPGAGIFWLYMNTQQGSTQSKEFRQAWNWLIDREAIRTVAYKDTGAPAWDLFMAGTRFSDPNYQPTRRDAAKAKELLAASGVSLPMEINVFHENDPVRSQEWQVIQANAAEVGIKLNIEAIDYATWLARGRNGDFTLVISSWAYRPDPDQYLGVNLRSDGGWNWSRYNSPEMDQLLDAQKAELDEQKRYQLLRQIAELMTEDAPIIPFIHSSNIKGLSAKVQGFVHRPDGLIRFSEMSLE